MVVMMVVGDGDGDGDNDGDGDGDGDGRDARSWGRREFLPTRKRKESHDSAYDPGAFGNDYDQGGAYDAATTTLEPAPTTKGAFSAPASTRLEPMAAPMASPITSAEPTAAV